MIRFYFSLLMAIALFSCADKRGNISSVSTRATVSVPSFCADSAYVFCAAQCDFGYRTMNSVAHEQCGGWIADKFAGYGLTVVKQKADVKGYDGTIYHATNIIASLRPEATNRILLCAHWDTRPWADNDPDESNHHKPIMGANDGASGVAVMIELARLLKDADSLNIGIDFICFDAEDSGMPQWETMAAPDNNTWALGSQYWAAHPHKPGYRATYGILLDMVGGRGAKFYQEGYSLHYAKHIVKKVWAAAVQVGVGNVFPVGDGGYITDDHVAVNDLLHIPTIDIVPHYPDCMQSSFGPTWHTVDDNMENIDKETLRTVGQTVLQAIYNDFAR